MTALAEQVARDRAAGMRPFLVVGTAGSVDTGAVDPLEAISALCRAEGLWFHVDAAFGALAALSPRLSPLLRGMDQADSLAFDFHKWAQVPYDCGCILVRDPACQLATFAQDVDYLRRETRGLAGGHPWPCDLGPDLSRGFRALKVWMTLRAYGTDRLGAVVDQSCALAARLAERIDAEPALERLAPVPLNIVCFRVRGQDDAFNAALVADLHEEGSFAPSTTRIGGRLAIRAAIVNHRTRAEDVDGLVDAVLAKAGVSGRG
jgi:aromatic-L-amino-acid decarboxylase